MDLREYYARIREIEAEIIDPLVVLVSRQTSEGGRRGVRTEAPRALAARLIAEGRAELASAEEAAAFRREVEQKWADRT